jgi:diguanylate cyclase (GGDEF)-like protein
MYPAWFSGNFMPHLIEIIITGPVLLGAGLLISSTYPVRTLIKQLPPGETRRNWYILGCLTVFFIISYISYALIMWNREILITDVFVSLVFFFGACFVWLVNMLSLNTAQVVRRISFLEQENVTDPLINIFNRRYFDRRLQEECERSRRYDLPLSILLLDIDHFKMVNDTYGHPFGDSVLKNLGRLLVDTVRNTDIVARFGGEEICIIATNTMMPVAVELAERMRLLVEAADMAAADGIKGQPPVHITVSIGVSSFDSGINTAKELMEHADKALYHAKSQGRNRVAALAEDSSRRGCEDDSTVSAATEGVNQ